MLRPSRQDIFQAVLTCCKSKLSEKDIISSYRIPGAKNLPRPVVVNFATKNLRDKVYESRKTLRAQNNRIYINKHLTKRNSEIFSKGRKSLKERKIAFVWTRNGSVLIRKTPTDRHMQIGCMEDLSRFT